MSPPHGLRALHGYKSDADSVEAGKCNLDFSFNTEVLEGGPHRKVMMDRSLFRAYSAIYGPFDLGSDRQGKNSQWSAYWSENCIKEDWSRKLIFCHPEQQDINVILCQYLDCFENDPKITKALFVLPNDPYASWWYRLSEKHFKIVGCFPKGSNLFTRIERKHGKVREVVPTDVEHVMVLHSYEPPMTPTIPPPKSGYWPPSAPPTIPSPSETNETRRGQRRFLNYHCSPLGNQLQDSQNSYRISKKYLLQSHQTWEDLIGFLLPSKQEKLNQ